MNASRPRHGLHLLQSQEVRADFPILSRKVNGRRLAYLDSGASTQRPRAVIDAVDHYETHLHANVHRGVHTLSQLATDAFEGARDRVRRFLNAASVREIIFVRGTTEAINLVAQSWGAAAWARMMKSSSPRWSTMPTWCRGRCWLPPPARGCASSPSTNTDRSASRLSRPC